VGGRGTRERIILDDVEDGLWFDMFDDAFNANPTSLQAALQVLAAATPDDGVGRIAKGRRVAVLGDMLELGPEELDLHRAVADDPALKKVDVVHCVGPRMRALYDVLPAAQRGHYAPSADEMVKEAHAIVDAGDVLLIKGSKGSKVSRVVDALRKLGHPVATDE
jgi:UDP-N-acetylmuramoyl-tripeptide--D-alanyl-D-alanine ligase